jgi:hypothetical protein
MSIFLVETYVVKAARRKEFTPRLNEFLRYKEEHPEVFPGLRSWRLYQQDIGSPAGLYIEMWEYDNLAAMEEGDRVARDDDGMKAISAGFHELVEPGTFATSVWSPVA